MSATDLQVIQHPNLDCLPSKRKLEDYDSSVDFDATAGASSPGYRKNTNSKEKSVVELNPTVRAFLYGESSTQWNGDCSRTQVQFFVRMISGGKTLVLQANLKDTVEQVHKRINAVTGIPLIEQRLIYNGKQLQWGKTLEDCSVQNDAGLQLVGRMRSTGYPRAWRVINDMVSAIFGLCREGIHTFSCGFVEGKLEQYMALPLNKPSTESDSIIARNTRLNDELNEMEKMKGKNGEEGAGSIMKADYCKLFLEACAPQALVMLYMSSNKHYRDCGEACIRSFVRFLKDLGGYRSQCFFYATVVLDLCRILRSMCAEDNLLYLFCRSTLGSMIKKTELINKPGDVYGLSDKGTKCISIHDLFPFFKELGHQLLKDFVLSSESNGIVVELDRYVCDFSSFLQPVIVWLDARRAFQKANGTLVPFSELVDYLFNLFNELLDHIDKCLSKMELHPSMKKEKEPKIFHCGWSEYFTALKALNSISMLYPGSEDQYLRMMRQNKEVVCQLVLKCANRLDDCRWLHNYKDILDFETRRHLAMLLLPEVTVDYGELLEMLIDRSQLLYESFEYISCAQPSSLHAGLFVEFKDEDATGPGVLREWFVLVCQGIFYPQNALLVACPLDRRRFYPNPASKLDPLHLQYFRFSDRVIALALMHKIQVGIILDRVFFLQLGERKVSLEDIQDTDPDIYNSCKQILAMDAELVDSDVLALTFVIEVEDFGSRKELELCPGGQKRVVNSQNLKT